MSFFFMKSFLPALSRGRVLTTVTRAWKIPSSNPSRKKKLFSSRLTGHFHLLPKLGISGVSPLLSHLPSRCLQGQLYFIPWFDKFLFILLNSIFVLSSIFWARLFLTHLFWIPLFSCFHGITGSISFLFFGRCCASFWVFNLRIVVYVFFYEMRLESLDTMPCHGPVILLVTWINTERGTVIVDNEKYRVSGRLGWGRGGPIPK